MTDDQHDQLPLAASPAPSQVDDTTPDLPSEAESPADGTESIGEPTVRTAAAKRRRGSRGGRNRKKPAGSPVGEVDDNGEEEDFDDSEDARPGRQGGGQRAGRPRNGRPREV